MASAPPERLDPVVSLVSLPAADETLPPLPAFADGSDAAMGTDAIEVVASASTPTAPSGFPIVGLIAAVTAHVLAAATFYALMLHEPPEEAKSPPDPFEVVLADDLAGRADGIALRVPNGAPRPDVLQDPDARAPTLPTNEPANDRVTTPQQASQPPSFDAMPTPPAAPPVPDTADAWAPRVHPSITLPLPPSEPRSADLQTQPTTETAKPAPPPKPAITPPAKPPSPAPTPPAPPPTARAVAPPVPPRPSMQRSIDLRDVAGVASSHTPAVGSPDGTAMEASYASLLYRAITRTLFYPPAARDRGEEGRVVLRVTIAADGRLIEATVVKGSGYPDLDAATIDIARRAAPYPPLPRTMGDRAWFNVPVVFGTRRL